MTDQQPQRTTDKPLTTVAVKRHMDGYKEFIRVPECPCCGGDHYYASATRGLKRCISTGQKYRVTKVF